MAGVGAALHAPGDLVRSRTIRSTPGRNPNTATTIIRIQLSEAEASRLRRQALEWLKADLAVYAQIAERDEPATKRALRGRLDQWWQDAALASAHDRVALGRLPEAERREWQQLWADVDALLKKVADAGSPL